MEINLAKIISKQFYNLHNSIKHNRYTHYWLKGGRGSTKSSFISIEIMLELNRDINANAVVLRKYGATLKDSVQAQIQWAISALGQEDIWISYKSPARIVNISTGQQILFRGVDEPKKIKSIKFKKGYCKCIWFEEVDEFFGMEEIRSVNQSLMRGGKDYKVFYSYNPPQSVTNWVNKEALIIRTDKILHHSTYLNVDTTWLGEQFIIEAEHLKKVSVDKYNHEYLGEVIGTGGEVFKNLTIREITPDEIKEFDNNNSRRGIDWGYATDPFHYAVLNYNKKLKKIYIYYEVQKVGLSNYAALELVKQENIYNNMITCDSAEPKSIDFFKVHGIKIKGAKKGPDSIDFGIKFLQDMEEIIIDPIRCPNTVREFTSYELEKDINGNFKANFPDKNNHSIDTVRYALEDDTKNNNKWVVIKNKK